jgi:YD repeat-containing protein
LLQRLTSATAASWSQTYTYDGFGNLKKKVGTGAALCTVFNVAMTSATNNGGAAGGDIDDRRLILNGEFFG